MDSSFSLAVHALVYLKHKGDVVSSEILASNICTNPARVRKVMAGLKKAGFVETKEGQVGGYRLSEKGQTLNLGQVALALQTCFAKVPWKSGDREKDCLVSSGMAGVMDEVYARLNEGCVEYLQSVNLSDLENRIFQRKGQ